MIRDETTFGLNTTWATACAGSFLIRIRPSAFAFPRISRHASQRRWFPGRRLFGPSCSYMIHFPVRRRFFLGPENSAPHSPRKLFSPQGPILKVDAALLPREPGAAESTDLGGQLLGRLPPQSPSRR